MKILITGGAGFIGCNTAKRFIDQGHEVVVFDNMSRKGCNVNLAWLKKQGDFSFVNGDLRSKETLTSLFSNNNPFDAVIHLAAQVAVTTSVSNPREDFEINALGTFNLLEAIRLSSTFPVVIYASTNKVYGHMENVAIIEANDHYLYRDFPLGIQEDCILDFHSPYGCSKGSADQYVRDYRRIYGLRTLIFRQSCIYGYRQFGVEDQGWVAWFIIASQLGRPITIYGDGKQVRDILFIDDLIDLYELAISNIDDVEGQVFNIGGGSENQLSLLKLVDQITRLSNSHPQITFADWRPGDQKVFVSNITKANSILGWSPKISTTAGIERLYAWVSENLELLEKMF